MCTTPRSALAILYGITSSLEGSHSGRVRRLGKAVLGKPNRGFESLTLRIDNLLVLLTRMLDVELRPTKLA